MHQNWASSKPAATAGVVLLLQGATRRRSSRPPRRFVHKREHREPKNAKDYLPSSGGTCLNCAVSELQQVAEGGSTPFDEAADAQPEVVDSSEAEVGGVGAELLHRRQALGLTLRQVATQAGVAHSLLGMIEKGQRNPSRKTLAKLKDALGIREAVSAPQPSEAGADLPAQLGACLASAGETELGRLSKLFKAPIGELRNAAAELAHRLAPGGLTVLDDGVSLQIAPLPSLHEIVRKLVAPTSSSPLSGAQAEVLAVVAHWGLATRRQVEEVRGVDSVGILSHLRERGWLEANQDQDSPGQPIVYRLSLNALQRLRVRTLEELQARLRQVTPQEDSSPLFPDSIAVAS